MRRAFRWWNPMDYLKAFYGAYCAEHPVAAFFVVVLTCAGAGAVLFGLGRYEYTKDRPVDPGLDLPAQHQSATPSNTEQPSISAPAAPESKPNKGAALESPPVTNFKQTNQPGAIGIQGTGNTVNVHQDVGGWPSLHPNLVDQAVDALRPYAGQRVRIEAPNGADSNRLRVVQQLEAIFRKAGWSYEPGQMMMAWGANGAPQGLSLVVKTVTPAASTVLQVVAGLYGGDNISESRQDDTFEDGLIQITVWPKRP